MGRIVITWATGGVYATPMPAAMAADIMGQLVAGRWANWEYGDQRGAINPAHVADVVYNEAAKKP